MSQHSDDQNTVHQHITKGIQALKAEASAVISDLSIEDAKRLHQQGEHIFIDVREPDERAEKGVIPGAFICPRGMMEFLIDPNSPMHDATFNRDKTYVFYCARGWRSLFAAHRAKEMGLSPVKNLAGGFAAWAESDGEVAAL